MRWPLRVYAHTSLGVAGWLFLESLFGPISYPGVTAALFVGLALVLVALDDRDRRREGVLP